MIQKEFERYRKKIRAMSNEELQAEYSFRLGNDEKTSMVMVEVEAAVRRLHLRKEPYVGNGKEAGEGGVSEHL